MERYHGGIVGSPYISPTFIYFQLTYFSWNERRYTGHSVNLTPSEGKIHTHPMRWPLPCAFMRYGGVTRRLFFTCKLAIAEDAVTVQKQMSEPEKLMRNTLKDVSKKTASGTHASDIEDSHILMVTRPLLLTKNATTRTSFSIENAARCQRTASQGTVPFSPPG